jgi:hypothetical protein
LEESIKNGSELIEGFEIYGLKGLVGNTFQRSILDLAQDPSRSSRSLFRLLKAFEQEALESGAKYLKIVGLSVNETRLINRAAFERLGYVFRQLDEETFEVVKRLF